MIIPRDELDSLIDEEIENIRHDEGNVPEDEAIGASEVYRLARNTVRNYLKTIRITIREDEPMP